ncbi:MAG TPA: polysaccharide deacetylase family protein, partial [Sphingomicrobium sp.]|nr:polysaccharide deacetylase family protein [Sphingomicrobium sp.]
TPESVGKAIIADLVKAHVPAIGFVNAHWTVDQPATMTVLEGWRAAGLTLGNHTWSHQHLSALTIAQFEEEVARDEPVLRRLAGPTDWRWLRYPFLDEGKDAAQRDAARAVLASRGYKIADVTMDFGDWQWTEPYARCRSNHDERSVAELERMYLAAARGAIDFSRALSHELYGRDIPYVILLHESAFEARMVPKLINVFRAAGFHFVTLAAAERDSFYKDRIDPRLPAGPAGLVNHAFAAGIKLPPQTDYATKLSGFCPVANPAVPNG